MTKEVDIQKLRKDYTLEVLDESSVKSDPFEQFKVWFAEAATAEIVEPNAMILATSTSEGVPSLRTVLLKDYDQEGFVFFTNYLSQKGRELAQNPNAALLFYWPDLERQLRIDGVVSKVSREQSEKYFAARPRSAQMSAFASAQSTKIAARSELEAKVSQLDKDWAGKMIPCPEHWGGYRVKPRRYEYWQGRESRLHDRIVYEWSNNRWELSRLAP